MRVKSNHSIISPTSEPAEITFSGLLSCFKYDYKPSIVHSTIGKEKSKKVIKKIVIIDTPLKRSANLCMIDDVNNRSKIILREKQNLIPTYLLLPTMICRPDSIGEICITYHMSIKNKT